MTIGRGLTKEVHDQRSKARCQNINTVITGQNNITGPGSHAMARLIPNGDAFTAFELAATTHGNQAGANPNSELENNHNTLDECLNMSILKFLTKSNSIGESSHSPTKK